MICRRVAQALHRHPYQPEALHRHPYQPKALHRHPYQPEAQRPQPLTDAPRTMHTFAHLPKPRVLPVQLPPAHPTSAALALDLCAPNSVRARMAHSSATFRALSASARSLCNRKTGEEQLGEGRMRAREGYKGGLSSVGKVGS